MLGKSLLCFPKLEEGILLKRYKRFLADIELENGEIVTAHCANTGPMKGVCHKGGKVRVRHMPSSKRKLAWTWEQAESPGQNGNKCWVGVNTFLPNTLVGLAIERGLLRAEIGCVAEMRKEVKYGHEKRSRIDWHLTPVQNASDKRDIYLEVKNTTWTEGDMALFPDTVTERGRKHLKELMSILPQSRAILVPCLSRSDVGCFAPGDTADLVYGDLYRLAITAGMEVIPCCFGFHSDKITWEGTRPFSLHQKSD